MNKRRLLAVCSQTCIEIEVISFSHKMFYSLVISLISIIIIGAYWKLRKSWMFWKELNVPCVEPKFPTGHLNDLFTGKCHYSEVMQNIYDKIKHELGAQDFCGIYRFHESALLVLSPEFAKTILLKDFNSFIDRGVYFNEKDDPMSGHLFFLSGQKWKNLRAKVAPTFTSAKLKNMFHTVSDEGRKLVQFIQKNNCKNSKSEIEIYDLLARFSTDVISSCAFGFEANSLNEPHNQFRTMGRKMIHFGRFKTLKIIFAMTFKNLSKRLGITFNDTDVADFFMGVVRDTINQKRQSGAKRNDFMQLMIDLMDTENEDEKLSFIEVAAQAYVFYFAGVSTNAIF